MPSKILDYIRICEYNDADMPDVKDILFAFSEEIRLRIMLLLDKSNICVNCLTSVINLPQPTISRHLALLRRTGVAEASKDKLHCYYTMNKNSPTGALATRLAKTFYKALKHMEPFAGDFKRLRLIKNHCDAGCKVRIK